MNSNSPPSQQGSSSLPERPTRLPGDLAWMIFFCLHLVGAVFMWRLLPHGFDWTHSRFWINEVLPCFLFVVSVMGLVSLFRCRVTLLGVLISTAAAVYLSAGISWIICFPISDKRPAAIALFVSAIVSFVGWLTLRSLPRKRWTVTTGVVVGLLLGIPLPWSQRAADPATRPRDTYSDLVPTEQLDASPANFSIADFVSVSPRSGTLTARFDRVVVDLDPLMSFISRSPDRCWTILAKPQHRQSKVRRFDGRQSNPNGTDLYYAGSESAILRLAKSSDHAVRVETSTALSQPVYSHLNSYCRLDIRGHQQLFLSFSPCPEKRIEVTYSQYPVGRPARLAYLDEMGVFRVVQASSGEKGPYRELARGPLSRDETLSITLYDGDDSLAQITLADFAGQASTQPSPTAGWGVAENAIEFTLHTDRPQSPASLWITLAGTSVGRGWDSVGHAPGVYRNRIELKSLSIDDSRSRSPQ